VRELRTPGFVRGALSNERPYRDRSPMGIRLKPSEKLTAIPGIAINKGGHAHPAGQGTLSPEKICCALPV
jgi:hypothetical protein